MATPTQFATATRAAWLTSSLILLDRQLGICRNVDGTVEMRVGDGIHTFFQLPLASSPGGGSATWGSITGQPAVVAAGATATAARAAIAAAAATDLVNKADLVGGLIPAAQLPSIAVVDYLGAVATQTAMLALTGQKGDWCTRTDLGTSWVITGSTPTQLSSWTQLSYPATPTKATLGIPLVDNTSDVTKPVSGPQAAELAKRRVVYYYDPTTGWPIPSASDHWGRELNSEAYVNAPDPANTSAVAALLVDGDSWQAHPDSTV